VLVESTGTVCPCLLLARIGHATPIAPLSPLSPPLPSHPNKYWIENFLFFSFSVLSQPVSTIFECFPIVFLSTLSSDSVASLKKLFLSHPTLQQTKKICKKKKNYPCDVLSAQPSSTIDTLNCWMCIFLLLLPSLPSLVLIFVICFIWGIVSFFSRFCGNIFFGFSFIVDTFAFFSRGFVFFFFFPFFFS